jgi:flagellar hook-basal body complex protein FliE
MNEVLSVSTLGAIAAADIQNVAPAQPQAAPGQSFAQLLLDGVGRVDQDLKAADAVAARFAVDDSVPLHEVTIALERARLSVEIMTLIRSRLVESYQEMMRMQL